MRARVARAARKRAGLRALASGASGGEVGGWVQRKGLLLMRTEAGVAFDNGHARTHVASGQVPAPLL